MLTIPTKVFCAIDTAQAIPHCDIELDTQIQLTFGKTCSPDFPLYDQMLVIWICAKLNYLLLLLNLAFLIKLWYSLGTHREKCRLATSYKSWFVASNMLWIIWRLQETVHLDTEWRSQCPYLCIVTNYLCYICQTGSLYMMALSSFERFQAIARPLTRTVTRTPCIAIGFLVGLLTSCINLANILTINDIAVAKTCHMRSNYITMRSLLFMLLCKILNLCLVYIIPAIFLICCNVATLVSINKKAYLEDSCTNHYKDKLNHNLIFVVLCSLAIVCCLPKPILELLMVGKMFSSADGSLGRSTGEVIADGVFINLTVIAFMLNTAVGIKYSAK